MRPLADWPAADRRAIRGLLFDIDDTLTTDGRLTSEAYTAIERLGAAGLAVVPITGRPAGWCDHIARMWPVDGVVGENGAFYFRYDGKARRMTRRFANDAETRAQNRERLSAIAAEIVEHVTGTAVASDQAYRETDLAIDYCEDVPPLPRAAVDEIVKIMEHRGLTAKVSSIHVNGWFGRYDKLAMTQQFLADVLHTDAEPARRHLAFIGDSPNDAPMFAFFENSIGVANVHDFSDRMATPPAYVTPARAGAGFRQCADAILEPRS